MKNELTHDERIEKILDLLLKYTLGDFHHRLPISEKGDELDAIIIGLNTLGEEAAASGRLIDNYEERANSIMNILLKYTLFDFSEKMTVSPAGDELDAIAIGLNTMAEEIQENEKRIKVLTEQLKEKIQQLEHINSELEAFTYSVSHDLRAPLRAINGYMNIIKSEHAAHLDDEARGMMKAVMNNSKKMGDLINDLLTLSRFNKKELQKRPVDMTQLAKQALDELKRSTDVTKAKITIHPLATENVDTGLMMQVFTNLLSNAIKYSSQAKKPVIELGIQPNENGTPIYYVRDNGTGFDMAYYDKLFGIFQRLHGIEEFEGTGVGLAIVKRIISRHDGVVWAEGKLNEGACFYFTLNSTNQTSNEYTGN